MTPKIFSHHLVMIMTPGPLLASAVVVTVRPSCISHGLFRAVYGLLCLFLHLLPPEGKKDASKVRSECVLMPITGVIIIVVVIVRHGHDAAVPLRSAPVRSVLHGQDGRAPTGVSGHPAPALTESA